MTKHPARVQADLVPFLLARIAEEEAVARSVEDVSPKSNSDIFTSLSAPTGTVEVSPSRVLAECAAKRGLIEEHDRQWRNPVKASDESVQRRYGSKGRLNGLWTALQYLALPYADHEDYQSVWKP